MLKYTDIQTYLHYNSNVTNSDLILVSSDTAEDASRKILYDPGLGHIITVTKIKLPSNKCLKEMLITSKIDGTSKRLIGLNSQIRLRVILAPQIILCFK